MPEAPYLGEIDLTNPDVTSWPLLCLPVEGALSLLGEDPVLVGSPLVEDIMGVAGGGQVGRTIGVVGIPEELVVEEVVSEVELCQYVSQGHHIDQHVATAIQTVAQLGRGS